MVDLPFDRRDPAIKRQAESLFRVLDPNGILAPGKQGIWPARYRGSHSSFALQPWQG